MKSSAIFSPLGTPALKAFIRQAMARGTKVNIQMQLQGTLFQVSFSSYLSSYWFAGHMGRSIHCYLKHTDCFFTSTSLHSPSCNAGMTSNRILICPFS